MARAPENSIEGFELALNLGATGIESDVWVTADGVAVLDHDGRVGRRPLRATIRSKQHRELPDHIPTLAQLFDLAEPSYPISLDVKDPEAIGPVLEEARRRGPEREQNLWLCQPDLALLTSWRPTTTARLINSIDVADAPGGLERRAAELADRSLDGLNLPHKSWNGGRVTLLHRFDLLALGWGPVHEREVADLVDIGIDAIFSDHVDRMMAVIVEFYGSQGTRPPGGATT
jgi:glycerophosphoryl diester phosphodiesterase